MLRKIQAILAVFTTFLVFVIFMLLSAPVGKAIAPDSVSYLASTLPPYGIDIDSAGNIYVVENKFIDAGTNFFQLEKFSSSGTLLATFPVSEWTVSGVAVGADGTIYVAEVGMERIGVYTSTGIFVRSFDFSAGDTQFSNLSDITMDSAGYLYLADYGNGTIKKFTTEGTFVARIGQGELSNPSGVDVAADGTIYVADNGLDRVKVFDSAGTLIRTITGGGHFNSIWGIGIDTYGFVYVTSMYKVVICDENGNFVLESGSQGTGSGQFLNPVNIDVTASRQVLVADADNTSGRVSIMTFTLATPTLTPTPTPTAGPSEWVTLGTPIASNYSGSVFVRTNKITQEAYVAYPEYDAGEDNYKITVSRFDETTEDWIPVGGHRFTNSIGAVSVQGRFGFDTCTDGSMVVMISDATVGGKATGYRYEGGNWVMLGSAGFSANNALNGIGVFCQPITQFPYMYVNADPGYGDSTTYGYNFNPGLGGWVSIQQIPCTTTDGIQALNPNMIEVDLVHNFSWYACSNGMVSEFTGTQWNPVVDGIIGPQWQNGEGVQDFAYNFTTQKWAYVTKNVLSSYVKVYESSGGSDITQLGTDQNFPTYYNGRIFPASLIFNSTVGKLWFALPTAANTFVVKEYSGGTWSNVMNPFTETGLQADDVDLYHDDLCSGASYVALAMQTGAGSSQIVVKRDSSFVPCPKLATVTTGAVSGITSASAIVGGNVTHAGYTTITERGIVYSSTNAMPTITDSVQTTAGTTGAMEVGLGSLTANTLYYARAYATNSVGVNYGAVVEFTTSTVLTPTPTPTPTLTPTPTTSITTTQTPTSTSTISPPHSVTPTGDGPPVTLPPITVSTSPTLSPRRLAQQSPICPIIVRFTSSPMIATKDDLVTLQWITSNAKKTIIEGVDLSTSGELKYYVKESRKVKIIADNGACIASATINFTNPGATQLQTATTVGASALVADILLQQIVTLGSTSLGTSSAALSANLWGIALSIFDRKKKKQAWGIAYDSVSKSPLGRVVVRLLNIDSEEVVDTVVSDAQGVFQLKTQPGKYIIRVVRAGYQFPSRIVKGESDGGYSNLYFGSILSQGVKDTQVMVAIPLDPLEESLRTKRGRKMFEYGIEAINTVSTITLFGGLGYSMYVAMLFPLPINIIASLLYGAVCIGKLLLTFMAPKNFGRVSSIAGKPMPGIELGVFDKEFDTLLYRTFTNEKGEYNFAVPNKEYLLKIMDRNYKLYSNKGAANIPINKIKRRDESEIRLLAIDMLVKQV